MKKMIKMHVHLVINEHTKKNNKCRLTRIGHGSTFKTQCLPFISLEISRRDKNSEKKD